MNHGSDVTTASSHSSEFEEDRRLKPEVKLIFLFLKLIKQKYLACSFIEIILACLIIIYNVLAKLPGFAQNSIGPGIVFHGFLNTLHYLKPSHVHLFLFSMEYPFLGEGIFLNSRFWFHRFR